MIIEGGFSWPADQQTPPSQSSSRSCCFLVLTWPKGAEAGPAVEAVAVAQVPRVQQGVPAARLALVPRAEEVPQAMAVAQVRRAQQEVPAARLALVPGAQEAPQDVALAQVPRAQQGVQAAQLVQVPRAEEAPRAAVQAAVQATQLVLAVQPLAVPRREPLAPPLQA